VTEGTWEVKPSPCPICGYLMDCASNADTHAPKGPPAEGDYTVCMRCTAILTFDAELRLTLLPPEVEPPLAVARVQRAMHQAIEWRERIAKLNAVHAAHKRGVQKPG